MSCLGIHPDFKGNVMKVKYDKLFAAVCLISVIVLFISTRQIRDLARAKVILGPESFRISARLYLPSVRFSCCPVRMMVRSLGSIKKAAGAF